VKPLDKAVAGLGGVLLVCIVVWAGARLVTGVLPGLMVVFLLVLICRRAWVRRCSGSSLSIPHLTARDHFGIRKRRGVASLQRLSKREGR